MDRDTANLLSETVYPDVLNMRVFIVMIFQEFQSVGSIANVISPEILVFLIVARIVTSPGRNG